MSRWVTRWSSKPEGSQSHEPTAGRNAQCSSTSSLYPEKTEHARPTDGRLAARWGAVDSIAGCNEGSTDRDDGESPDDPTESETAATCPTTLTFMADSLSDGETMLSGPADGDDDGTPTGAGFTASDGDGDHFGRAVSSNGDNAGSARPKARPTMARRWNRPARSTCDLAAGRDGRGPPRFCRHQRVNALPTD